MKKFIFLLIMLSANFPVFSQNFVPIKSSFSFDINSCQKVDVVNIDGTTFDVYATKKGARFIKVGEVGKEHPMWIGTLTDQKVNYNGKQYYFRKSKSGKTFILVLENNKPKILYGDIK